MAHDSGVLIVDKPAGPTSHDLVRGTRRLLSTRAVGHAGTLDPMATGVMVLLVGEATKLSPYLTADAKRYRATVTFGRATDTLDAWGTVVREMEIGALALDSASIQDAVAAEAARAEQIPPNFSAVRVAGRRAHEESRKGRSVLLAPRPIKVHEIALTDCTATSIQLELTVSKGYYVRSLARDLGDRLGLPSHLSSLRRLASGNFRIEEAHSWPPAEVPPLLGLTHAASRALAMARLTDRGVARARVGQKLDEDDFEHLPQTTGACAWVDADEALLAIGHRRDDGAFAVLRGFR